MFKKVCIKGDAAPFLIYKLMTNEELLKEVKERYPIGTAYICAQQGISNRHDKCVIDLEFYQKIRYNYSGNGNIDASHYGFIRHNDKWAEILDTPNNNNEDLIGRYLKALVDEPNAGAVQKDEIGKIIEDNFSSLIVNFPSQSGYASSKSLIGTSYELMPKEFEPENIENTIKFKIGQKIKYIGNVVLKEKNVVQTILDISNKHILTNLTSFDIDSDYYIGCVLVEDETPTFKFEVGKWYKFRWDWDSDRWYYGKFKNFDAHILKWDIWFRKDGSNLQYNAALDKQEISEYSLLTDLSEIQQYLPDGHVDKIVNNIPKYVKCLPNGAQGISHIDNCIYKVENGFISCEPEGTPTEWKGFISGGFTFELSTKEAYEAQFNKTDMNPLITTNLDINLYKGKYYVITYTDYPEKRYVVIGNYDLNTLQGINIQDKRFFSSNCFSSHNIKIQEALFSDRAWLDRCIKAGKYLPKEELNKEEPKPEKAVVHCTTQEEWDFVSEKLGYSWSVSKWSDNKENSCININRYASASKSYYEAEGFKIYPFKQWCDLSGCIYTESKQDLETVNYQKLQDKAWEMYKHVKVGDKYIATNGREYVAYKDARKSSCDGLSDENCYIHCGYSYLWEIKDGKEKFATLLPKEEVKTEKCLAHIHDPQTGRCKCGHEYKVKTEEWVPKKGDWIIRIQNGDSANKVTKGKAYQIIEHRPGVGSVRLVDDSGNQDFFTFNRFRKAEPHEIPGKIIHSTYKEICDEFDLDFKEVYPLKSEQSFKPTINRIKTELIPVKQLKTKN